MAGKKIGLVLALDGEKEFTQAVQNAHKETKLFESQLKGLTSQLDGNANTLESLTKKNELLIKAHDSYKRELEAAEAGLDNANKKYREQSEKLDDLSEKLNEAKKAQKEMEDAGQESTEAYEKQTKAVNELEEAVEKQSLNRQKAAGRITDWNKRVYESETALNKSEKAIAQNEKYIEEARKSADKCATSIDNMGKEVKDAGSDFEEANRDISTFSDVLKANLTGSAIIEGLKTVGEKAIEAGKYVVDVGSSFEAGMSEVAAISGATGSELEALTEKAKEMGAKTKFSASESAEAMNYMAMAGWKTSDMLNGIEGIMNLAAASGEDLATTSDIVTDALTGFGLTAADSGHFADILAQASSNANTNVSMMGETFKYVAPVAGSLGYSAEDASVAIGLMANSGIKASQAGTALRTLLTNLAKPTDTMAAAMDDLGISLTDTSGEMKPLSELMEDLRYSFSDLTEEQKASYAATIAGKEGMSGLLAIVNASESDYNKLAESIANCDGAAEKMAATMQDNLSGKITILGSALEGLGIAAYEYVSGPLQSVVEGVTGVINGITDAITPQKTVLEEFIDDISATNEEKKKLIDDAKNTWSSAQDEVAEIESYKKTILELNEVEGKSEFQKYQLKYAVEKLSDSIPELSEAWDEETGKINLSKEAIDGLITNYEDYILHAAALEAKQESWNALYEITMKVVQAEEAVKLAEEELDKSKNVVDEYGDAISDAYGNWIEAKKNLEELQETEAEATKTYNEMGMVIEKTSERMAMYTDESQKVTDAYDAQAAAAEEAAARQIAAQEEWNSYMQQATDQFVQQTQEQISMFSKATNLHGEELQKATEETLQNMQSQAEAMTNWADNLQIIMNKGINEGLLKYLADMGPQGAEYVAQFAAMTDEQIKIANDTWETTMEETGIGAKLAGSITGEIEEMAEEIKNSAKPVGTAITDGTSEGIDEGKKDVVNSTNEMAEASIEASKTTYDSHSPSRVMQKIGNDASQGLANGILEKVIQVATNAKVVALVAVNNTEKYMPRVTFYDIGKNVPDGLSQGILAGRSKVVNSVASLCESAVRQAKKTLDINSPSKVFEELGDYSAQGYGIGFENKMAVVRSSINAAMKFSTKELSPVQSEGNLTDTIENALYNGMIYAMSKNGQRSGGTVNVTLNIDGQKIADRMIELNNEYINRNGNSMF